MQNIAAILTKACFKSRAMFQYSAIYCILTGGIIETETNVSQIEVQGPGEERGWETKRMTTYGILDIPLSNTVVGVVVVVVVKATEVKGESGVGEIGTAEEETREEGKIGVLKMKIG